MYIYASVLMPVSYVVILICNGEFIKAPMSDSNTLSTQVSDIANKLIMEFSCFRNRGIEASGGQGFGTWKELPTRGAKIS